MKRIAHWKYIRWLTGNTEELFDLHTDPYEKNNLGKDPAHAADLDRLRARLATLKKEVGGSSIEELKNMPSGIPRGGKDAAKKGNDE